MSLSFQDLQEALTLDDRDEFIIWQNSSRRNKRVKRGNLFASKGVTVRGKFIDVESGNDVGLTAAAAEIAAGTALVTAQGAQDTADGKNRIFYSDDAPSNPTGDYDLRVDDIWYDTNDGYKMSRWTGSAWEHYKLDDQALAGLNVGKLTAGFISSQVLSILGTTSDPDAPAECSGYIESTNFIPTWVPDVMTVRIYNPSAPYGWLGKQSASDVVRVKVLQGDGSYKLFKSVNNQGENAANGPPASGNNSYWHELTGGDVPTITLKIDDSTSKVVQNFGFRIVANGYAEFGAALFRGAIVSNEGFFGDRTNAVRIDSDGLTVGDYGRLKSASLGYNGTSFFVNSGTSGGFFLGNTQAENDPEDLYQLFVGKPTGNNLWWNGTNLLINGSLAAFATGTAGTSGFGLTIGSGFGIRYINNDSVLTITGGISNNITNGAQIDLVGSNYLNGTGGLAGLLILQSGSGDGSEIRLQTNVSENDATVAALRMTVANTGLVTVVKSPVAGGSYNTGAGNLYVNSNLGVGRAPENQDTDGGTDGRIWASEEMAVYNGSIRSVILKKTDGSGMVFLRNGDDSVTITLNGGSGEISASSYNSSSSKRFKKKIKNLKTGLDTINSLRPVTFDWKNKNKQNDIGLIAEEVDQILPMVVAKNENGEPSGLDYGRLTTVLIQAVKELSAEVEKLKSKIKS